MGARGWYNVDFHGRDVHKKTKKKQATKKNLRACPSSMVQLHQ